MARTSKIKVTAKLHLKLESKDFSFYESEVSEEVDIEQGDKISEIRRITLNRINRSIAANVETFLKDYDNF